MYENEMTRLSQVMYDKATSGYLQLSDAVAELRKSAHVRTVLDTLSKATGIPAEDKSALSDRLLAALTETDPSAKRDSVARKIRIWLNGETRFISKEGAIQLAFALGLSLKEAGDLTVRLCEEGLHWRDPEELVYLFGLKNGLTYEAATALLRELREAGAFDAENGEAGLTADVEYDVSFLSDSEAFKAYLISHRGELGKLHNTAYSVFTELMELLMNPDSEEHVNRENVSVRDIVSENLFADLIPRFQRAGKDSEKAQETVLSALQKSIRDNWPDETTLSKMINRKTDVTRKVLILLFLATDGGTSVYGDWSDAEQSKAEIFEARYERLKIMLIDCGFAPLDPRSPFDWMVLYCMCVDDLFLIDEQMQGFLREMFPE